MYPLAQTIKVEIFWQNGKLMYQTLEDIHFKSENIRVRKGFRSDGPTIPRILWIVLPKTETYLISAIIHDYCLKWLYRPWSESNRIMRRAMRESGVQWYKRWPISVGIEIGRVFDYVKYWVGAKSNINKIKNKKKNG